MTDGLEFAIADIFDNKKLNQKTTFVGNTTQIGAINTTYAGQEAYPTESSNDWILDRADTRDAENTKWFKPQLRLGTLTTIGENPGVAHSSSGPSITSAGMYVGEFTLPTTEKFYQVTTCAGKGGNVSGTTLVQSGVDVFNTSTNCSVQVALSPRYTYTDVVGFTFYYGSRTFIPGGSTCRIWIAEQAGVIWRLLERDAGNNATTWTTFSGGGTSPYTGNANTLGTGAASTRLAFQVTYQGYY